MKKCLILAGVPPSGYDGDRLVVWTEGNNFDQKIKSPFGWLSVIPSGRDKLILPAYLKQKPGDWFECFFKNRVHY